MFRFALITRYSYEAGFKSFAYTSIGSDDLIVAVFLMALLLLVVPFDLIVGVATAVPAVSGTANGPTPAIISATIMLFLL